MNSGKLDIVPSEVQSLKFRWNIPECSFTPEGDALSSSPFNFANATWCLQLHPNENLGAFVSLMRQHSLIWLHKITCSFIVVGINDYHVNIGLGYSKLKYNEDFRERKYFLGKIYNDSAVSQKIRSPDGSLTLEGHLLCKKSKKDECLKKCGSENSDLQRRLFESNTGVLSLKTSKAKTLKIQWKIPEYFSLPGTVGYSLNSPLFDFGCATWFFKLYPNGTEGNSDAIVSLVRSHSLVPLCHEIIYICDIMGDDGKGYNLNSEYGKFCFSEDCEIVDPNFPYDERSEMFEARRVIAPDGDLTFLYKFFFEESVVKDEAVQKMSRELDMYRTFGRDMKNLLLNGKDHDLILKVQDKEFRVHRHILSVRSPVFESMLTHDMAEKNSGIVDIPDCDSDVLEQLLLYVYCGKVEMMDLNNVQGLYYAADKYDMILLKDVCRDFIQKSLSYRNFCDIVQLAMNHGDEDLEKSAIQFFMSNGGQISTTEEWISFMKENEDIANEILNKVSRKAAEKNNSSEVAEKVFE